MSFCSIDFIFIFLPLFVLLHGIAGRLRNTVLFAGSLLFYALLFSASPLQLAVLLGVIVLSAACVKLSGISGRGTRSTLLVLCAVTDVILLALYAPDAVKLLLFAVAANYFCARLISVLNGGRAKAVLITGIVINAGILVFFKYANEIPGFVPGLTASLGLDDVNKLIMPVGLSFYTFKNISYLHQVYAKQCPAEDKFIDYGAYMMLFAQIMQGPIQTYAELRPRLKQRTVTAGCLNKGLMLFIAGMGLKVIIANRLGSVWNGIEKIGIDGISTPLAWLGAVAYSLQLYFDFFGYSLMAEGIGEMLGYGTPKNFDYPYAARSMSDFWRRWHITLGTWFKQNVYFPLGGNRRGKARTYLNLFVVWMLTGIWHGSTLNFVIWGLFLFAIIALEKSGAVNRIINNRVLSHVYMVPLILLSWVIFRTGTPEQLLSYLSRLFPFFGPEPEYVFQADWVEYAKSRGLILIVGILLSTPLIRPVVSFVKSKKYVLIPLLLAVFWYSVYLICCGANDPFMYGNF